MWRAYGGRNGVAIVLNTDTMASDIQELGVFSAPVEYRDVRNFVEWFGGWCRDIIEEEDHVRKLSPVSIREIILLVFRTFLLATKHPGFSEEREWRIFHSPDFEQATQWVENSVEIVRGIPQRIIKLKFHNDVSKNITGLTPNELINRVIIGPSDSSIQVRDALLYAMQSASIQNPEDRIWMSHIPLRHSS
jgi:hypothetical protein